MEDLSCYFDDISSIESSSRRERKYSEETIKSLSYAVQRLATKLETKEAELKMKERAEVNFESKVLDLMIENAVLKNRVTDLEEEVAPQDSPTSQQRKDQRTPATSDDYSSFQREVVVHKLHDDKENGENVATRNGKVNPKVFKSGKPPLARRSSGPTLPKLIPRKLPNIKSGLGGRSLFTSLEGGRLLWGAGGLVPKLIPRRITALSSGAPDDMSDLSSL